jgi:hypothetical protein
LINAAPIVAAVCRGERACKKTVDGLNEEFAICQESVVALNRFKYKEAWHRPHVAMQTAVYELGEIAELYHLQDPRDWRPDVLSAHYRLQWYSRERQDRLYRFMRDSLADADRDLAGDAPLLKKALLPGPLTYGVTWPLWNVSGGTPWFFQLIRGWAYSERMSQRHFAWPDALRWMASPRRWETFVPGGVGASKPPSQVRRAS